MVAWLVAKKHRYNYVKAIIKQRGSRNFRGKSETTLIHCLQEKKLLLLWKLAIVNWKHKKLRS